MKKKKETIHIMSSVENTLHNMEKFNPYQCGHGFYEDKEGKRAKRSRRKAKERKEINSFLEER